MNKISGKIINFDSSFNGTIEFGKRIKSIKKATSLEYNYIIIPGFVDLHCHGGNNFDVMSGLDSIKKLALYHLKNGTTTLLPTTITSKTDEIIKSLHNLQKYIDNNRYLTNILGVHLEGPFINPNKLGAQPPHTQLPNIDFIKRISKEISIKIMTLAPELQGIEKCIQYLEKNNIKVQIGHSLATYACCMNIIQNHNIGFTHLYNAMSGNDHRNPGVVTAALRHAKFAEIICDLHHVSKENIHLADKCISNLYAVSDAISACGMPDGEYKFANHKVIKKDGIAVIDFDTLAGSVVNMHETFRNLLKIDFSLEKAVAMTSYNASKYLSLKDIGMIKEEYFSNFVVLDKNLDIKKVFLYGNLI